MKEELSPIIDCIQIEYYQSGAVKVVGSIQNKQHALALIDAARDAIINYHNSPIIIPNAMT